MRRRATRLHRVAMRRNAAVVRDLLEVGVEVNARTKDGATPLHWAVGWNTPAVIRTLLDAGADAAARDDDGITSWYYAQDNKALKGSNVRWRLNEGRWRLNEGRFEWGHGPDLGKQRFQR